MYLGYDSPYISDFPPLLNIPISINKVTFVNLYKIEYKLNGSYNLDGEPEHLCDIEDTENIQYFDMYALPEFPSLDAGENSSDGEVNESVSEIGEKSIIYLSPQVHIDITVYQI